MTGLAPSNIELADRFENQKDKLKRKLEATMTVLASSNYELSGRFENKKDQRNYITNPRITIDFGTESYMTPQTSGIKCALLSLDPPSPPHGFKNSDKGYLLKETASIMIPDIGSEGDNKARSPSSSFKLQPRKEYARNFPPHLRSKSSLSSISRLYSQSKIKPSTLKSQQLFNKYGLLSKNIQNKTVLKKMMSKSRSFTAMSVQSRKECAYNSPPRSRFKSSLQNTSQSKPSTLKSQKMFNRYGLLSTNIQDKAMLTKNMSRSYSFTAMSA